MLGERLREMRERKGLTQRQVAPLIGVKTANALSLYERGLRCPDPDVVSKLAILYETTSDYLLGLTDDPRSLRQRIDEALADEVELRNFWDVFKQKGDFYILVDSVKDLDPVTLRKIVRAVQGFLQNPSGV